MKKHTITFVLAGFLSAAILSSSAALSSVAAAEEIAYPLTITDDLGTEVTIDSEPEKAVSLSPSCTEILFAIGAGDRVSGRTDYCDYPAEAAEVPSVGSYSDPNMELIIAQSPDVVFASDYIDDSIRSQLEELGANVIVFSANDVNGTERDIELAGQIMNCSDQAKEITRTMTSTLDALKETIADEAGTKSAFIDLGFYYSAGTGSLLGNMLNDLGVINIADDSGELWPQLSVETIIEKNPDLYISLYTTPEELKQVSGLNELDCIAGDHIIYYDGLSSEASMIQRPGPVW